MSGALSLLITMRRPGETSWLLSQRVGLGADAASVRGWKPEPRRRVARGRVLAFTRRSSRLIAKKIPPVAMTSRRWHPGLYTSSC